MVRQRLSESLLMVIGRLAQFAAGKPQSQPHRSILRCLHHRDLRLEHNEDVNFACGKLAVSQFELFDGRRLHKLEGEVFALATQCGDAPRGPERLRFRRERTAPLTRGSPRQQRQQR